jgi:hypothetical protein
MSIGSWSPDNSQSNNEIIDATALTAFIALSEQDLLGDLNKQLTDQQKKLSSLMSAGKTAWIETAEKLNDEQLVNLVRFFTLVEMQLPGWEAGAESPVVWIVKVLRRRKSPPSKELLLWIKANSDNKFLPNGAL